jgi:hypothetical protein
MGQPVPEEMDGRVLLELFTPEFRQSHEVAYGCAHEHQACSDGSVYSDQEQAEMRDMLQALGYVT